MILSACAAVVVSCFVQSYAPPAKYDYEPTEAYFMKLLPKKELYRRCGGPVWGCANVKERRIYVLSTLRGKALSIIVRHEKAHLNGWVHK